MYVPLVSVIITTHNRVVMLKDCIDSVLASDYGNFEIIVVNDNSSDDTKALLDTYGDRIVAINNETSAYMIRSRNIGAFAAGGRYLCFVDDDNMIEQKMLTELVKIVEDDSTVGIVGPLMLYANDRNVVWWSKTIISTTTGRTYFPNRNDTKNKISTETIETDGIPNVFLIRKSLFEKLGGFDESYIDTWTEGDFCSSANLLGYRAVRTFKAETYHRVLPNEFSGLTARSIGDNPIKAYTTMRNRYKWMGRYATPFGKFFFLTVWSWLFFFYYSYRALRVGSGHFIPIYIKGVLGGLPLLFHGRR